jgi:hypothetical protein
MLTPSPANFHPGEAGPILTAFDKPPIRTLACNYERTQKIDSNTKTSFGDAQSIAQARAKKELISNPHISQPLHDDAFADFSTLLTEGKPAKWVLPPQRDSSSCRPLWCITVVEREMSYHGC